MRRRFQIFLGGTYPCSAKVGEFGVRHMPHGLEGCMLLYDLCLYTGSVVVTAQHCWTELPPRVAEFDPHKGDIISFDGIVKEYYKLNGRGEERLDYNVGLVGNIDLITRPYDDGLRFSEYWGNVRQSHLFNSKFEEAQPCIS